MSSLEVIVTPDMDLLTAAPVFLECHFSCLPILDSFLLVGRLIRHDVLKGIEKVQPKSTERQGRRTTPPEHESPSAIEDDSEDRLLALPQTAVTDLPQAFAAT